MCNICKNSIAKMFLVFLLMQNCGFDKVFFIFVKNLLCAESQNPLGGCSQNLKYRYLKASECAVQIYGQIGS